MPNPQISVVKKIVALLFGPPDAVNKAIIGTHIAKKSKAAVTGVLGTLVSQQFRMPNTTTFWRFRKARPVKIMLGMCECRAIDAPLVT